MPIQNLIITRTTSCLAYIHVSDIHLGGEGTWETGRADHVQGYAVEQHEPHQGHQVEALYPPQLRCFG